MTSEQGVETVMREMKTTQQEEIKTKYVIRNDDRIQNNKRDQERDKQCCTGSIKNRIRGY